MTALPSPHGNVDLSGRTLTVTREVPVPVGELWTWITDPELTARWYGGWTGEGQEGATVQVTMAEEEGAPESPMVIETCRPPHRLALRGDSPPPFDWRMELTCTPATGSGTGSVISLRHTDIPDDFSLGEIGAGWEFYLDRLVCAIEGHDPRPFEDFMAGVSEHYDAHA